MHLLSVKIDKPDDTNFILGQTHFIKSMPAVLHLLQGEARLTLGDDAVVASPGTWVHMPKGLRHSIQAMTPVVMLLLLLK
jgi:quercetin dioxygenase-like cupin family protein